MRYVSTHWCTASEAAHRLGLPVNTVERLVASGAIHSRRMGRRHCLSIESVEGYALRRRGCGIR